MTERPKRQLLSELEQMSLPTQVMGASLVEVTGGRQVLLAGQKGIRVYSSEEILVDLVDCAVNILGDGMRIVTMTAQELLIRGVIRSVEWLR